MSFRFDREVKSFSDKQKLIVFISKRTKEEKGGKKTYGNQSKTIKKMAVRTYMLIITLKVNWLMRQSKVRVAE